MLSAASFNDVGVHLQEGGDSDPFSAQATTEEFHPLTGMRRWGVDGVMTSSSESCPMLEIWTEAYETPNNLVNLAPSVAWNGANAMWISYLSFLAKSMQERCGGSGEPKAALQASVIDTKPRKHPWRP
jgi:hypothetical protein